MSHDPTASAAAGGPYRLAPLVCRHVQRSRAMILRAAGDVTPGRAAILGAGACAEIPLAELAERFGEVVVNDIDEQALSNAVDAAAMSAAARSRLRIVPGDLTGLTQPALVAMENALRTAADSAAGISAMAQAVAAAQPTPFLVSGTFDLVVASCVLSQLHFALARDAAELFERRFAGRGEVLRNAPAWQSALYSTARRMENTFIADVASLMGPAAHVYLSESAQMCYVELAADGMWQTPGTYRMLRTTDLADYVRDRFEVVQRDRWEWVVGAPNKQGETGRLYDVQALVLRRAR